MDPAGGQGAGVGAGQGQEGTLGSTSQQSSGEPPAPPATPWAVIPARHFPGPQPWVGRSDQALGLSFPVCKWGTRIPVTWTLHPSPCPLSSPADCPTAPPQGTQGPATDRFQAGLGREEGRRKPHGRVAVPVGGAVPRPLHLPFLRPSYGPLAGSPGSSAASPSCPFNESRPARLGPGASLGRGP